MTMDALTRMCEMRPEEIEAEREIRARRRRELVDALVFGPLMLAAVILWVVI